MKDFSGYSTSYLIDRMVQTYKTYYRCTSVDRSKVLWAEYNAYKEEIIRRADERRL